MFDEWRQKMEIKKASELSMQVVDEVERAVVGKRELLETIMAAALAGGHVLLEDYPGLGKTLIARSFASALGLDFKRIQFTPDLLRGYYGWLYFQSYQINLNCDGSGLPTFVAERSTALLPNAIRAAEAMQEGRSHEGKPETSRSIPSWSQNPIEYEGTFPLPEAQLDRFMLKLTVGYPDLEEEKEILQRRRLRKQDELSLRQITKPKQLLEMRAPKGC
jgi:MoxR-like ATPase